MHKLLSILSIFLILVSNATGQTTPTISISNSTLISTADAMPFWLWANTDGKIEEHNSFLNLSELNVGGIHFFNDSNSFLQAGTDLNYAIGNDNNYFQANQLFARINLNNWEINIGIYHNELYFNGLSTSNGNMAKSRNARPYPKISLSVADYKPVPWIGKHLSFKGEFDEGILDDERYVDRPHLHHKSLYLKSEPFKNFSIEAGMEHFVMWGGTSQNPTYGELPSDFSAYWKYITGASGDENFPETDQANVAGNQYGTYQLLLKKQFQEFEVAFNLSHPFEDLSGINWRNWPDNILGFTLKFKDQEKLITHILYEYTNTRQQGIIDSLYRWIEEKQLWQRIDYDNYFSHSVYNSGVSYHQKMMSSPLFYPVKIYEKISRGPQSTRLFAHHIGLKGKLNKDLTWTSKLTYIQHIGNWGNEYAIPNEQVSAFLSLYYSGQTLPFDVDLTFAGDISNVQQNRMGIQIGFHYQFLKD